MTQQSYELVPTTDREANLISQKHGFESVAELAASLPEGANVIDVGSGASPFGREVAELRPDISWTNYDYSYNDPRILDEVSDGAPSNVRYVAGDATKLSELYDPESFDAVFSYWMIPHLSIDSPEPAKEAAKAMFTLAKDGALISIGPAAVPSLKSFVVQVKAYKVVKDKELIAETFADTIVAKTKLPRFARFTQKTANKAVTPLLGTSRWATHEGRVPKIYHRETGEYVSPFSKKGAHTTKEVVLAGSRHVAEQHRSTIRKTAIVAGALATGVVVAHHVAKKRKST